VTTGAELDSAEPVAQAGRSWAGLRALVLELHDRRKDVVTELDLSFIRAKALIRVAAEPLGMRRLAARLGIDAPYTSVIVGDLEQRGLVTREPHPRDRRAKLVRATDAGRREAARANRILDAPPAALLALPPEDLAHLDRIVATLLDSSDEQD
jgi:DNA-binding MarR family transcriptional regulator